MAGTLSVQKIQGLATSATPTVVEVSSGHTLAQAGSIINFAKTETNTAVVFANNSTFTTFLSLNYTPIFANSIIVIDVSSASVSKTTGGAGWIGARIDIDDVDSGTIGGAFMYPTASNDTRQPFYSRGIVNSWGTAQKTIAFKTYGASTTASWSHQNTESSLTVMEVVQ